MRANVVPKLLVREPDTGIAVVAGVQRPRSRRGQIVNVAPAENVAGRQGTGRDIEHVERRGERAR